jgi:hypothetical protein
MDNPRIATAMLDCGGARRRRRPDVGFFAWLARRLGLTSSGAPRRT